MAFDPAAVMISPSTSIIWEWTGDGGTHNVAAESNEFESEYSNSSGHTYEYTFEDSGVFKYVCEPHRSAGMKGAIVVD
jgi:halocyanin-like protein